VVEHTKSQKTSTRDSSNEVIAQYLNQLGRAYNFHVAPKLPKGKPASGGGNAREFRMQLINTTNDTSNKFKSELVKELKKISGDIKNLKFNELSPNSSKYSSVSFDYLGKEFDVVVAKGANKGENFEKKVVSDLERYFAKAGVSDDYADLIKKLSEANSEFSKDEIVSVNQRTGSTKKEGVPIERLNEVIGDIILTTSTGKKWYISLKDTNGETFSSYPGAQTLLDKSGNVQPDSPGAKFVKSFGANLNEIHYGFLRRKMGNMSGLPASLSKMVGESTSGRANQAEIKAIFERAWGMNYFYVRRTSSGFKVFWLGRKELNALASNIRVTDIKYPSKSSKQITVKCSNDVADYVIEVRNSSGGEYPNDIKIKATRLKL